VDNEHVLLVLFGDHQGVGNERIGCRSYDSDHQNSDLEIELDTTWRRWRRHGISTCNFCHTCSCHGNRRVRIRLTEFTVPCNIKHVWHNFNVEPMSPCVPNDMKTVIKFWQSVLDEISIINKIMCLGQRNTKRCEYFGRTWLFFTGKFYFGNGHIFNVIILLVVIPKLGLFFDIDSDIVSKKQYTWLLIITSANVDRFTKFFRSQIPKETLSMYLCKKYCKYCRTFHLTLTALLLYLVNVKITADADFNSVLHVRPHNHLTSNNITLSTNR